MKKFCRYLYVSVRTLIALPFWLIGIMIVNFRLVACEIEAGFGPRIATKCFFVGLMGGVVGIFNATRANFYWAKTGDIIGAQNKFNEKLLHKES